MRLNNNLKRIAIVCYEGVTGRGGEVLLLASPEWSSPSKGVLKALWIINALSPRSNSSAIHHDPHSAHVALLCSPPHPYLVSISPPLSSSVFVVGLLCSLLRSLNQKLARATQKENSGKDSLMQRIIRKLRHEGDESAVQDKPHVESGPRASRASKQLDWSSSSKLTAVS